MRTDAISYDPLSNADSPTWAAAMPDDVNTTDLVPDRLELEPIEVAPVIATITPCDTAQWQGTPMFGGAAAKWSYPLLTWSRAAR